MRSSEILNVLLEIERRHEVAEWRIAGVRVWPLARVWLYINLFNRALHQEPPASAGRKVITLAQRIVRARLRVARASWQDRANNATPGARVEAVFYSDGVSFVKVDGLWYDKLFDPIIGWLRSHDAASLMLTPLTEAHHPRRSPSMFVQPRLDLIKVLASLRRKVAGEVALTGFDAALSGTPLNASRLLQFWARLSALCDYFTGILQQARPARAFVNTYYSIEGMAFVLACRRGGVTVADVQHGLQGDHHVAYGQWSNSPPEGYELLPDEFWVWSDLERRAIDAWRPPQSTRHVPVVAGNAWLELWRNESEPFMRQALTDARRMRRTDTRCCVLVTLQWGLPEEETLKLLRAIRLAPRDFQWWLRLHPVAAHDRRPIRFLVEQHQLTGIEIDGPTDLPLHALLKVCDVHVTHSSSTVIEAAEFLVPSVVTSQYGAQFFQAQIEADFATVATTDREIAAAVSAFVGHSSTGAAAQSAQDGLERALARAFPHLLAPRTLTTTADRPGFEP